MPYAKSYIRLQNKYLFFSATEPLPAVGCPWWMAPEIINYEFYDQRVRLINCLT